MRKRNKAEKKLFCKRKKYVAKKALIPQSRGKLLVKAHPGFSEKVCGQEGTM